MFTFLKRHCDICGEIGPKIETVSIPEYAGTKYWHFHNDCVKKVLCNPFDFGVAQVDLAIEIAEIIKGERERVDKQLEERIRKAKFLCDYLNNKHKIEN